MSLDFLPPVVSLLSCVLGSSACLLKWFLLQKVLLVACCRNSTCIPFNFCLITCPGWPVSKSVCLPCVWGVHSHLCIWVHFVSSSVALTSHRTKQTTGWVALCSAGVLAGPGRAVCACRGASRAGGCTGSVGSAAHGAGPHRATL